MKQRLEKLEQKIEVQQKVDCTVSWSLQDRLQELSEMNLDKGVQKPLILTFDYKFKILYQIL
jgi:hypothetical protein